MTETEDIILTETSYSTKKINIFVSDKSKIVVNNGGSNFTNTSSLLSFIRETFVNIFLPFAYPDSVSEDYVDYQIWDTVQAFCSTLMSSITTQAVLKGFGVGDAAATPLAAATAWILRDGFATIGRLMFTWWQGHHLDANNKQWRIMADVLNDLAALIEIFLPYFLDFAVYILCITSILRALVAVLGGATRASVIQHQAIKGNMADVAAKDGSQEIMVNLFANFMGLYMITYLKDIQFLQWILFTIFMTTHLFANYCAVRSLVFKHVNTIRFLFMLQNYLKSDSVATPKLVNQKEPLFFMSYPKAADLCGFDIRMGESLLPVMKQVTKDQLNDFIMGFAERKYIIIPDFKKRILYISFEKSHQPEDVLKAYFHAVLFGIGLGRFNNFKLSLMLNLKRQLHHQTPLHRIDNFMKSIPQNNSLHPFMFPLVNLHAFNDFVKNEETLFFTGFKIKGWEMNAHSLIVQEWNHDLNTNKKLK